MVVVERHGVEIAAGVADHGVEVVAAEEPRDYGLFRPDSEVERSRWLARLLRPPQTSVTELFDVSVPAPPAEG